MEFSGCCTIHMYGIISGCGSRTTICAVGLFNNEPLELNVKNEIVEAYEYGRDGMRFRTTGSYMDDVSNQAEQLGGQVDKYVTGCILWTDNQNNTKDGYYLWDTEAYSYISNMGVLVNTEDNTCYTIQFPLHLISDLRIRGYDVGANASIYENVEYELYPEKGIDDILTFYRKAGWYEVEKTADDSITITGYTNQPARRLSILADDYHRYQQKFPIQLCITQHAGIPYLQIKS